MISQQQATLPITTSDGTEVGGITVALLPANDVNAVPPPLLYLPEQEAGDSPQLQLLEGHEYRYEIRLNPPTVGISTDRPEVVQPDDSSGLRGRLRPDLYTGTLPITLLTEDGAIRGRFAVEVRSRKLNYLSEYRWMLRDIAEQMAEAVMDRFAVAERGFTIDDARDAATLYQRFAFLRSLISGEAFSSAIHRILSRPHVGWISVSEVIDPGRGLRADSFSIRQLSKAGPRVPWPQGLLPTLPSKVERRQTISSTDTTANRFVKFALTRWREVVAHMADLLELEKASPIRERGLRETKTALRELDAYLAAELFRECGELSRFPADDQVLMKREGYRDILRSYIEFELAARLSWTGGDRVYGAGQKDVAALYEYWAFLQLARMLSELLDTKFDFAALLEVRQNGFNLSLKSGQQRVLTGSAHRHGRSLAVSLWFNRSFGTKRADGSWTLNMRPDCSIEIRPAPNELANFEPVLLHFDAKYRLNFLKDLFGSSDDVLASADLGATKEARRGDVLKMHAYRDAIRRSVGAYVMYPGTEEARYPQYRELLPGLGAFPLSPVENGSAAGLLPLKAFLEEVLEHVALQVTQHERSRYWLSEVYKPIYESEHRVPAAPFINLPPADTWVLLGYVRDRLHWDWITTNRRYNLRAYGDRGFVSVDSKKLACNVLILSCPETNRTAIARITGQAVIADKDEMTRLGYPSPRGHYFCLPIEVLNDRIWEERISPTTVEQVRAQFTDEKGAPVAITWLELTKRL